MFAILALDQPECLEIEITLNIYPGYNHCLFFICNQRQLSNNNEGNPTLYRLMTQLIIRRSEIDQKTKLSVYVITCKLLWKHSACG